MYFRMCLRACLCVFVCCTAASSSFSPFCIADEAEYRGQEPEKRDLRDFYLRFRCFFIHTQCDRGGGDGREGGTEGGRGGGRFGVLVVAALLCSSPTSEGGASVCVCVCVYVCMFMYVYTHKDVCVCVFMYIYLCMFISDLLL